MAKTTTVRREAVAGSFYPSNCEALQTEVNALLANSWRPSIHSHSVHLTLANPKAIIVPHAGYIYSGSVAATAYKTLAPVSEYIKRVVLLGPSHRVCFRGVAYCSADYYQTPLGQITIDHASIDVIKSLSQISELDKAHQEEHSLEVQLPFLQTVLGEFSLIPLVVGDAKPEEVAEIIDTLWGKEETLIVISTDLSHFLNYQQAIAVDTATNQAIEEYRYNDISYENACGRIALQAMLKTAQHRQLNITTLDLRNSGDTAGTKDRVVGYGAWVIG